MKETSSKSNRLVAYKNEAFLDSPAARSLRILSEYLEPLEHFRREKIRDTIVFFGSARIAEDGPLGHYYRLPDPTNRFVVCSGGGPGIMEAANRGAADVNGKTIGLNIGLPFEQLPNPYITPELNFEFHYFFMRKFWFSYLAKAMVIFPGGYGSMDEMMEVLTLVQTKKLNKKIIIVLYGSSFWKEIINFDALVKYGTISPEDVRLFEFADDPDSALKILQEGLMKYHFKPEPETPAIAKSRDPDPASTQT